jgi:hypothetical protein
MVATTHRLFNLPGRVDLAKAVDLSEAMASIDLDAVRLFGGLSADQLSWCPRPGRWSIAQNLAHLRITAEVFLPAVDAALETTRNLELRSKGPFRLKFYGRLLVWQMEARPRPFIKLQAPKALQPKLLGPPPQELGHFLLSHAAMRQRAEAADGLHLTGLRFSSPLAGYIRVNLLEFFSAFNAHSRRHLRQADNVRQALASWGSQGQA